MPDHSPEPWPPGGPPVLADPGPHRQLSDADMRRAIACVNALAGIEDPKEWVRQAKIAVTVFGEGLEEFCEIDPPPGRTASWLRVTPIAPEPEIAP